MSKACELTLVGICIKEKDDFPAFYVVRCNTHGTMTVYRDAMDYDFGSFIVEIEEKFLVFYSLYEEFLMVAN